ncbi:MAG TPA: ATP synthase F1 subunit delta [Terriglobales bacterium]|nr:ATP synthase F1 subunit delta [Terriglobales bacterium]
MAAVTSRYARALVDVIVERKLDATKTMEQLDALVAALEASPPLRNVWENPSVPAEQKRKVLDVLAARLGADKMVRNFLAVLIDNRRIAALAEIARQFRSELYERLGIAEAEVTTTRELAAEEKRGLEAQIAKLTGKKVQARYATDGKILGGAVVRVGSTIYDGSVKGQLRRLKEALSAN